MDKEIISGGLLIVTAGIGWSTGKRRNWVKRIGWAAATFGIGVIVYGTFKGKPVPPPTVAISAATGGAASMGQTGGITAGSYRATIYPSVTPEERARKKKIREQLGIFITRLWAQDVAARSGWSAEERIERKATDPSYEIQEYLKANLDESYSTRFLYPEPEDLSKRDYSNTYIGRAESETARTRIKFLTKVIEELK